MPDWKCEVVGGLGNHRRNRLLLQERKSKDIFSKS